VAAVVAHSRKVQGGEFVLSVQVDRLGKLTDYNPFITPGLLPGYNCGNKIWNKKGSFPPL
jgi:hypothetical protein